jgi:hypothetical protein
VRLVKISQPPGVGVRSDGAFKALAEELETGKEWRRPGHEAEAPAPG